MERSGFRDMWVSIFHVKLAHVCDLMYLRYMGRPPQPLKLWRSFSYEEIGREF